MLPRRILVPLDGSRLASRSIEYLHWLASTDPLEVRLLGVIDETQALYDYPETEFIQQEREFLTTHMRRAERELAAPAHVSLSSKVVSGIPSRWILEEAIDFEANLLVVTTRGRGATSWPRGRVADKLIRGASCDILVIPADALEPSSILVPLDGSPDAEVALEVATSWARRLGSELRIARVVSMPAMTEDSGYVIDKLFDSAADYLDATQQRLHVQATSTEVLAGVPEDELREYATRNAVNLIVLTRSGSGGAMPQVLGSVTDRLLSGRTPMLIVKP